MLYQLKSGKVIQISVEQYLDMTDADLEALEGQNSGDFINSPFYGSVTKKKVTKKEDSDEDTGIDYIPDDEESVSLGSYMERLNFEEGEETNNETLD